MNIDKIYKPLKLKIITDGVHVVGISSYDIAEVLELEEKYKELFKLLIELHNIHPRDIKNMIKWWDKVYITLERHTGMKWEDIINED